MGGKPTAPILRLPNELLVAIAEQARDLELSEKISIRENSIQDQYFKHQAVLWSLGLTCHRLYHAAIEVMYRDIELEPHMARKFLYAISSSSFCAAAVRRLRFLFVPGDSNSDSVYNYPGSRHSSNGKFRTHIQQFAQTCGLGRLVEQRTLLHDTAFEVESEQLLTILSLPGLTELHLQLQSPQRRGVWVTQKVSEPQMILHGILPPSPTYTRLSAQLHTLKLDAQDAFADINDVAAVFSMQNLTSLTLKGFGSDSGRPFTHTGPRSNIQHLHVQQCNLNLQDLEALAACCGKLRSLKLLNDGHGSGYSWFEHTEYELVKSRDVIAAFSSHGDTLRDLTFHHLERTREGAEYQRLEQTIGKDSVSDLHGPIDFKQFGVLETLSTTCSSLFGVIDIVKDDLPVCELPFSLRTMIIELPRMTQSFEIFPGTEDKLQYLQLARACVGLAKMKVCQPNMERVVFNLNNTITLDNGCRSVLDAIASARPIEIVIVGINKMRCGPLRSEAALVEELEHMSSADKPNLDEQNNWRRVRQKRPPNLNYVLGRTIHNTRSAIWGNVAPP